MMWMGFYPGASRLKKILLTLFGFAVGTSIGKEVPIVQIGCTVMNILGRFGLERSHSLQCLLILAAATTAMSHIAI